MIASWMLGIAATAALLALAARTLEEVLRGYGWPVRWVWVAALAGSLLLPFAGWLTDGAFPGGWLQAPRASLDLSVLVADAVLVESAAMRAAPASEVGALVERMLIVGWLLASASVLALYFGTWRRLGRSRREWQAGSIEGTPVLVSGRGGPAVIGLMRPAIVVPAWLLEERDPARALVVLHEREHVRARDHALLALAPLAAVAMPWNPAVWWQLRRLRLAVELDCDRRVLATGIEPRTYGTLLLEIAGRTGRPIAGAAALAEPRTFLERRIVAMTRRTPRFRLPRAVAYSSAAGVLALIACETAAPTNVNAPGPSHDVAETAAVESKTSRTRVDLVADREPIVILDGVVVPHGVIRMIDPASIGRVEVLKGAAAAARYGREADVVEITTKEHDAAMKTRQGEVRLRALKEIEATVSMRDRDQSQSADVAGTIRSADGKGKYKILPTTKAEIEGAARAKIVELEATKQRTTNQSSDLVSIVDGAVFVTRADRATQSSEAVRVHPKGVFTRELMDKAVVILDGVTIADEADLAAIEPSSIASVEILKAGAARALGITDGRAVVRIETKR